MRVVRMLYYPRMPAQVNADTPAMRQYRRFKEQHPGCVLFFRMGDFYEMFHEDAQLAHRVLGVTLTQRTAGVPMAGVPYHAVEGYLRRMIQSGHRVAVCDQVQDPREAKGVVDRDVTRVITPGTLTDDTLLEEGTPAPLASVVFHGDEANRVSIAWAELSTGAFAFCTLGVNQARDELARVRPSELLYCETADGAVPARVEALQSECPLTARPGWQFRHGEAFDALRKQYAVAELTAFDLSPDDQALPALGAVLGYLLETQRTSDAGRLAHLRPPRRFARDRHLVIDQTSLASLEVERTLRSTGSSAGSLVGVIGDNGKACETAMGKRRLREWLCYPLSDLEQINTRQDAVSAMVDDRRFVDELGAALSGVQDLPRIAARLSVGRATPRDLVGLGRSVGAVRGLATALEQRPSVREYHERMVGLVPVLEALHTRIGASCVDEPPAHLREGGLVRGGVDAALDEMRSMLSDSDAWLSAYQAELCQQTGIGSLKVGFNKVFGYFIEVTAANKARADEYMKSDAGRSWMRKQTLKNAERYITPALKDYEGKALTAQERAVAREQQLFEQLCGEAQRHMEAMHAFSEAAADLDVLRCFAERAVRRRYVRPAVVEESVLVIESGRHPVLDELLGDRFVPNELGLGASGDAVTLNLITGPNMAGKSTYIRQAALIALLAHTGSFVPASSATVGLCDRIFTRVGAHDELHAGRSTFMVEMTETANICHHATGRSLVILDEIGRGTSTLDGLSLAWAIAEHLAGVGCRALFATHYHELTSLPERFANVRNLSVLVREWNDQIVFLHRIEPGAADRSYGIHVAKLAGLPDAVVKRANELLKQLAVSHGEPGAGAGVATKRKGDPAPQMSLFTEYLPHPAVESLRTIDLSTMTPMQAFDALRKLVESTQE